MRITGGSHRSRVIQMPKGQNVRPTSGKTRQSIFNILQKYDLPAGTHVLDVFCGTGILGLEALSRGAKHCVFLDNSKISLTACKDNIDHLGFNEDSVVLLKDALKPVTRRGKLEPVSLVFIDPPYEKGLITPSLAALIEGKWMAPGAICVLESEKNLDIPLPEGFTLKDNRFYGNTQVLFFQSG